MFIEKTKVEVNSVVTLKLVGGDEIIGRLESIDSEYDVYSIKRPLLIMIAQQGFGFMPYIVTGNPEVTVKIDGKHVIAILPTIDTVSKEYTKQITNGLLIP